MCYIKEKVKNVDIGYKNENKMNKMNKANTENRIKQPHSALCFAPFFDYR